MDADTPERAVALAATDRPLPLRLLAITDERAPEGTTCLGAFLGPRMIARCAVAPAAAEMLLAQNLFREPVRLALAAREGTPGLQCQLYALVDLPPGFPSVTEEEADEEEAPWAASVPGAGYEAAVAGEDDADEDDDEEEIEEPAAGTVRQAAIFLGEIVRFDRDRKHSGDLALEAVDVLRTVVQGEVSEVVDKVLEDLLGEAGGA
jgi:hypothetical protein